MNKKSVIILNLLLIAVLCVSLTSCDRGNRAVMAVVVPSAEEIPEPPAEEPEPPAEEPEPPENILLTLTHKDANSLTPINGIKDWDGWRQKYVWEGYPDGTRTEQPPDFADFPEMFVWRHWIYVHATSALKYDISGIEAARFGTYFSLTEAPCIWDDGGKVRILVYSDQKIIYQSEELGRDDNGMYIEFNIPDGTEILTILADKLRRNFCDNVVFGEPTLFASGSTEGTSVASK